MNKGGNIGWPHPERAGWRHSHGMKPTFVPTAAILGLRISLWITGEILGDKPIWPHLKGQSPCHLFAPKQRLK